MVLNQIYIYIYICVHVYIYILCSIYMYIYICCIANDVSIKALKLLYFIALLPYTLYLLCCSMMAHRSPLLLPATPSRHSEENNIYIYIYIYIYESASCQILASQCSAFLCFILN